MPQRSSCALVGQRPQPRAHEDVARLAQVAREEDDDPELRELRRLELDRADLDRQERAVHLRADAGQPRHQEQRDARRGDQVAVALEHVVVVDQQDASRRRTPGPTTNHCACSRASSASMR